MQGGEINCLPTAIYIGENRGVSRILSRYYQNYPSFLDVYGAGLSGLNLYYKRPICIDENDTHNPNL